MGDEVLARLALLSGMALAGKCEGALDLLLVDGLGGIGLVLLDHSEEITEQRTLIGRELAGDGVGPRRACASDRFADAGMPAALLVALLAAVALRLRLRCLGYACGALLRRNRMASRGLAAQS